MEIRAALLEGPHRPFTIETLTLDAPRAGEVLVRLVAVGVCHSDWHLVTGATQHPMPVVAGHEGAGIVEVVGPGVTRVQPGDHVVLSWTPNCGECFYCQHGKPNLCETFTGPIWAGVMLDGTPRLHRGGDPVYHWCGLAAFADHTVVPQQACVKIQPDAPLEIAALVGCAVATGVGATLYTSPVRPGDTVAVIGCGGVGLNILMGAQLCGAGRIIAIDSHADKLTLARAFGATDGIQAGADVAEQVRALTGGRGVDHAFEAVGLPSLQELALDCARPGGSVVLVGLTPMGTPTNLPGAVIARTEKVVRGCYYGSVNPSRDFPLLIDLYLSGRLALDRLISARYHLDQINEAYADMLTGGAARGIIVWS